eukprot:Skav236518  [mRNA]  locus=scaffold78:848156:848614:- [translate_table: standard]
MKPLLRDFINPIETKLALLKQKIISKEMTLKTAIEKLDDEKVSGLIDLFSSSSRINTEERIFNASSLLLDEVALLDMAVPKLSNLKIVAVELLIEAFAHCYSVEKGTELAYSADAFLKDLRAVEAYRRGLRNVAVSEPSQRGGEADAGCEIM